MKHNDTTLQAAIDAAMLELETGNQHPSLDTYQSSYWRKESPARLALAKAFLAKLPQPEPILADDGRSLGQVEYEAMTRHQFETTALRAPTWEAAESYIKDSHKAMAQAVANVVLAQAIRRMEAVPVEEVAEIIRRQWLDRGGWIEPAADALRARLIQAAKGHGEQPDTTDWKAKYEQAEAERKKWEEDALRYCKNADYWKSQAETIGILRPLSEAGPVPDGCVRMLGNNKTDGKWTLAIWEDEYDTHFADIRLPVTETPATEPADPYARLKAYAKAGARIRVKTAEGAWGEWYGVNNWRWCFPPEDYEVHPDDLHMVPEYAPVNEQPKQKVPLGPEEKLQAIKDILEIK